MTRRRLSSSIAAVALFAGTIACGVRDVSLAPGEGGAAGEEPAGGGATTQGGSSAGGASGTGTAGASGGPSCPEIEPSRFAACWLGGGGGEQFVAGLRVVGAVDPDPSACTAASWPRIYDFDSANFSFVAWELQDSEGNRWVIQFSVNGATSDILSPDDIVNFNHIQEQTFESGTRGLAWLEQQPGRPLIAVGIGMTPYSVVVEPAEAFCPGEEGCGTRRSARVTVGADSAVVPMGEVAVIGGLAVANGHLRDYRGDNCGLIPAEWLELGVYTPP